MTKYRAIAISILFTFGATAADQPSFEVTAIHLHVPGDSDSSSTQVLPGGRFTAVNVTARKLIRNAFGTEDYLMSGAPGWVDSESYDMSAKTADGVPITRENIQPLLLGLLESRFGLHYHRETKEMTVYNLEAVRNGVKLKPHSSEEGPSMSVNSHPGLTEFRAVKTNLADFANILSRQTGRPVKDKTGLSGEFDIELQWSADQNPDSALPSIFTAVQSLGLRLNSAKGTAEVIVIDAFEHPAVL